MTVTVVNSTGNNVGSGTSHNVVKPASMVAGDVALLAIYTPEFTTHNTPAGWSLVDTASVGGFIRASVYLRVIDGTEGADFTVTTGSSCSSALVATAIRGSQTTVDVIAHQASATPSATITAPTVTATSAGILLCIFGLSASSGTWALSTASGMTENVEATGANVEAASLNTLLVAAGATGAKTSTATGGAFNVYNVGFSLVLRDVVVNATVNAAAVPLGLTVPAPTIVKTGDESISPAAVALGLHVPAPTIDIDQVTVVADVDFLAASGPADRFPLPPYDETRDPVTPGDPVQYRPGREDFL